MFQHQSNQVEELENSESVGPRTENTEKSEKDIKVIHNYLSIYKTVFDSNCSGSGGFPSIFH